MRRTRRLALAITVTMVAFLLASGVAVAATFLGTSGDDTIKGTDSADWMRGHAGNDTISGRDGDDNISGEHGDDTISGNSGGDTIEGGLGNDYLFGTDEDQTGIEDGNRTSTDGDDVIRGGDGDDTVVGATGADELQGGRGDDDIFDGPLNDTAVDYIYGGEDADEIIAANVPASRDVIDCGAGTDTVQADSLDSIGGDCENVEIVEQPSTSIDPRAPITAQGVQDAPPVVVSTESGSAAPSTTPTGEDKASLVPPPDPTATSGDVTAQGYNTEVSWVYILPGYYRGYFYTTGLYPEENEWWGIGLYNTSRTVHIRYKVYYGRYETYDGANALHEWYDPFDWWSKGYGVNWYVYMRTTSKYSTVIDGYDYYRCCY